MPKIDGLDFGSDSTTIDGLNFGGTVIDGLNFMDVAPPTPPPVKNKNFLDKPIPQFAIGAGERALDFIKFPADVAAGLLGLLFSPKDRAAVIENVPTPVPGSFLESLGGAQRRALSAFTPTPGSISSPTPPSSTTVTGVGPEMGGKSIPELIRELKPETPREFGQRTADVLGLFLPFKGLSALRKAKEAEEALTVGRALKLQTQAKSAIEKARFDAKVSPLEFMDMETKANAPFEQFYDEAVQGRRLELSKTESPSIVENGRQTARAVVGGFRAIIGEAQERILTEPGKVAAKMISTADGDAGVIAGKSFEKWRFGSRPAGGLPKNVPAEPVGRPFEDLRGYAQQAIVVPEAIVESVQAKIGRIRRRIQNRILEIQMYGREVSGHTSLDNLWQQLETLGGKSELEGLQKDLAPQIAEARATMAKLKHPQYAEPVELKALPAAPQLAEAPRIKVLPEQLNVSTGEVDNLKNVLEGQSVPINDRVKIVAQNSRAVLNDLFQLARESGVKISGFLENYLPRFIQPQILDEVYGDLRAMKKNIEQIAEQRGLNEKSAEVLAGIAQEKLKDFSVFKNPRTRALIEHLQTEARAAGRPVSLGSLFVRAERLTSNELTGIFGNLERGRKLMFPLDFYVQDPREAISMYIQRASKRISEVRNFGIDNSKMLSVLDQVGNIDPTERAYIEGIIRDWTGVSARDALQVQGVSKRALSTAQELFIGSEFIAKIALGTATLKQFVQPLISTAVATGYKNFFGGVAKLFTPEMRSMIRQSGAIDSDIIRAETNSVGRPWIRRLGEKVGIPFVMANRLNFYTAGAAFNRQIDQWLRLAKNPLIKESEQKIAQEALSGVGIDWTAETVNQDEVLRAMYRFANDTQLMRNVLRDPRWINNPNLRSLALFQRFKLGQFNLTKDIIRDEFKKNTMAGVGASLRWAIGASLSGAFNVWAVKQFNQLLSGKPVYDDGDTNWQKFVNAISESGGGGWFTDVVTPLMAGNKRLSSFGRQVGFNVFPVPLSETIRVGEESMHIWQDIEAQRHFGDVLQRSLGRGAPQIGPAAHVLFDDAFMTNDQIKERRDREKRMIIERASLVRPQDSQVADDLYKIYNFRHPDSPIANPIAEEIEFLKSKQKTEIKRLKFKYNAIR